MKIPFNKPYWGVREEQAAVAALRGTIGAGAGPNNTKLEQALTRLTGARYALAVTSCTHGMELAMAALGAGAGDEVIVPSFTMTSTANCVVLSGATPVFADIEPRYYNLDPDDLERKITRRTKGVIVVHYAGMPVALKKIRRIARKHSLWVVEDAAHAIGAVWQGRMLGTIGDIGVYSFHGTKNVSCGEGGAVLTDRKDLADRMEIYRANGTNRKAFFEGEVDKYSWVGKGTSFYLSDILASIADEQIAQIKTITKKRQQIARYYTVKLKEYSSVIELPVVPDETEPNWHIYAIRFRDTATRTVFMRRMRNAGIEVATHYVPLHTSEMGKRVSKRVSDLPVTDLVAGTLVRLPIYPGLTEKELTYIVSKMEQALQAISGAETSGQASG